MSLSNILVPNSDTLYCSDLEVKTINGLPYPPVGVTGSIAGGQVLYGTNFGAITSDPNLLWYQPSSQLFIGNNTAPDCGIVMLNNLASYTPAVFNCYTVQNIQNLTFTVTPSASTLPIQIQLTRIGNMGFINILGNFAPATSSTYFSTNSRAIVAPFLSNPSIQAQTYIPITVINNSIDSPGQMFIDNVSGYLTMYYNLAGGGAFAATGNCGWESGTYCFQISN